MLYKTSKKSYGARKLSHGSMKLLNGYQKVLHAELQNVRHLGTRCIEFATSPPPHWDICQYFGTCGYLEYILKSVNNFIPVDLFGTSNSLVIVNR